MPAIAVSACCVPPGPPQQAKRTWEFMGLFLKSHTQDGEEAKKREKQAGGTQHPLEALNQLSDTHL